MISPSPETEPILTPFLPGYNPRARRGMATLELEVGPALLKVLVRSLA